jgi:hypothetical protein
MLTGCERRLDFLKIEKAMAAQQKKLELPNISALLFRKTNRWMII